MSKKIVACVALAILTTGVGVVSAAPVKDYKEGQTSVGYGYYDCTSGANAVYGEYGVTDKILVGVQYAKFDEGHVTDVYGKYRLQDQVYAYLGGRDYNVDRSVGGADSKWGSVSVGVEGIVNLAPKVDAYASLKYSSRDNEYKIGVGYQIDKKWGIDLNYTKNDLDEGADVDGMVIGVNYTF